MFEKASDFSSSLKPKRPQYSQDGEYDASSTSCSQCDARENGNFEQGHHKWQKMGIINQGTKPSGHSVINFDKRFLQSFPQRQIKNIQQLYKTKESEKNKEICKDSHHDDPGCMTYGNWYKVLWRECKKQAKRIVSSEADAGSSSDESISDEKEIFHKNKKSSLDTRGTRRPSDSRKKLNKHFVPDENLTFPSSEGDEVKIESWDRVTYCKILPSVQTFMIQESAVSSHVSTPNQNRGNEENEATLVHEGDNVVQEEEGRESTRLIPEQMLSDDWINILPEEVRNKFINKSKSIHPKDSSAHFKLLVDITNTSEKTGEKPKDNETSAMGILASMQQLIKRGLTFQNRNNEQKEDTLGNKEENEEEDEEEEIADNFQENDENPATSKQLDTVTTRDLMQVENRKKEEKEDALGDKEENKVVEQEEVADNFQENDENPATSKQLDTFSTKDLMQVEVNLDLHMFKVGDEATTDVAVEKILENIKVFKSTLKTSVADKSIRLAEGNNKGFKSTFKTSNKGIRLDAGGRASIRLIPEQMLSDDWINSLPAEVRNKFINKSKSIHPEDSVAHFKLLADITATSDSVKTGEKPVEDSLAHFKLLADITTTSGKTEEEPVKHKTTAAQERSKHESTLVKLYRNVMRNETSRMMKSIDMVVSEAKHLFGVERTMIFFDLLDDELFHFGSAGAISNFLPNMAESFVRQHVTSFFEHACDMMNILMTLLLGCPGSEILQQMPEQMFISLLRSVMVSFVKSKPKGGKGISSKGTILIMVDSMTFERALGDGIPEGILVRLSCGDKILVGRFADARPERIGASEIGKNNPIHYIFFSYDCRLFIYIPTENGSYWHQLDMQRANRIRQQDK